MAMSTEEKLNKLVKDMAEIRCLTQTVGSTASDAFATIVRIRLIAELALLDFED